VLYGFVVVMLRSEKVNDRSYRQSVRWRRGPGVVLGSSTHPTRLAEVVTVNCLNREAELVLLTGAQVNTLASQCFVVADDLFE